MSHYTFYTSPLGEMLLTAEGEAVTGLHFVGEKHYPKPDPGWQQTADLPLFRLATEQLDEYFAGRRRVFDLPLAPRGTPFQKAVWSALGLIPYAKTWSYVDLAKHIGDHKAARAVGAANGHNPISIVVPCHRVIGSNGSLTGYAGGLERKQKLLALEAGRRSLF